MYVFGLHSVGVTLPACIYMYMSSRARASICSTVSLAPYLIISHTYYTYTV
jgi:hypothetical protein